MTKNYTRPDNSNAYEAAATAPMSWTIPITEQVDAVEISVMFTVAPATSENVTVTLDAKEGADYDRLVGNEDAAGCTVLTFRDIKGLVYGDALVVEYTNTDGRTISGSYTLES